MFKTVSTNRGARKSLLLFASLFLMMVVVLPHTVNAQSEKDRAEIIENATFQKLDGSEFSVDELEGKMVLVDFWETWCGPCLQTFPTMQKLMEEYPDRFVVLAVTPGFNDTQEDVEQFIKKNDYDFTYVMDKNSNVSRALGIRAIPFKIVLDEDGEFVKTIVGSKGGEKDYESTKKLIQKHSSTR